MPNALKPFKNKYSVTIGVFLLWMLFFDRNDLISQFAYKKKLHALEQDKLYFTEELKKNQHDLEELKSNPRNLEKFAREKYLMKKENEDVFVILKK